MKYRWFISKKNLLIIFASILVFHLCFLNISYVHAPKYENLKFFLIILLIPYLLLNIKELLRVRYHKINLSLALFVVSTFVSSFLGRNYKSHSYLNTFLYLMIIVIAVLFFECLNIWGKKVWNLVINIFFYLTMFYTLLNDFLMIALPSAFKASDKLGMGDNFNRYFLGNKFNVVYLHLFLLAFYLVLLQLNKKYNKKGVILVVSYIFAVSIFVKCSTGIIAVIVFGGLYLFKIEKYLFRPIVSFAAIAVSDSILFINSAILSVPIVKYIVENVLGKGIGLTGRMDIYARVGSFIIPKIWFGYGFDNNTSLSTRAVLASNVQNGVLDNVVSFGVIGTAILAIFIWLCLKYAQAHGKYNAFTYLMYAYIVASSVEIVLRSNFIIIVALIAFCNINSENSIKVVKRYRI